MGGCRVRLTAFDRDRQLSRTAEITSSPPTLCYFKYRRFLLPPTLPALKTATAGAGSLFIHLDVQTSFAAESDSAVRGRTAECPIPEGLTISSGPGSTFGEQPQLGVDAIARLERHEPRRHRQSIAVREDVVDGNEDEGVRG